MSLDPMPDADTLLRMKAEREQRRSARAARYDADVDASIERQVSEAQAAGDAADARDEKRVAAACDKQLRALGFVAVNFSQPRESKQTPGIPDREYFHPGRGIFLKWEAKTARGVQSPAQRQYQEWCARCGVTYLVGTDQVVYDWLVAEGIAFEEGGLLVPLPYRSPESKSA